MRSINVKLEKAGVTLDGEVLGCAGEKGAVQLLIDVSSIAQEGVNAAFLRCRMPDGVTLEGETVSLPEDGPLVVTVPDWAMSERGRVQMQLTLTGADKTVRSYVWSLRVLPSLEVGGTPPEAVRTWLAQVEESIAQALDFCTAVSHVSITAQTLEAGAQATASGSVSAEGLQLALGIPTGAQGPAGAQGAKGDKGDPGAAGAKGEKGDKGDKGDPGDPGTGFAVLDYYATPEALQAAVPSPTPGDAYGVGAGQPYDIYIYGGTSGWVNNGALQGAKGDKGDTGATGAKGDKGDTGETGATGADGYTPVRGTDYWTASDIAEMKAYVDDAILGGEW